MMTYDVLTLPAHKVRRDDVLEYEGVTYYVVSNGRAQLNGRAAREFVAVTLDRTNRLTYYMARKAPVRILRRVK